MAASTALKCPKCGGTQILHDPENGEDVCIGCGLVLGDDVTLDRGPEHVAYTLGERNDRQRTGMGVNPVLFDKGMSTFFHTNADHAGKPLSEASMQTMNRLKRVDNKTKLFESQARNLSTAMSELDKICDRLKIPAGVKTNAALIYRRALDANLIRGRSIEAFVAASIYAACRGAGVPRKLSAISQLSSRDLKEISRCYRTMLVYFNMSLPVESAAIYVPPIASKLGLSHDVELSAVRILAEAKMKDGVAGKDPTGLAGAALYLASRKQEHRTQRELAAAAGVTEVTLRNRMKGLIELIGEGC